MSQVADVIIGLEDKLKDAKAKAATLQTQLDTANAQISTLQAQVTAQAGNLIDAADTAAIADAKALLAQP